MMKELFEQYEQSRVHAEAAIERIAHLIRIRQAPSSDLIEQANVLLTGLLSRYTAIPQAMTRQLTHVAMPHKGSTVPEYQAAWETSIARSHELARDLLGDVARIRSDDPHYAEAILPLQEQAQALLDGIPEHPEAHFRANLAPWQVLVEACAACAPLTRRTLEALASCGDALPRPVIFGLLLNQYRFAPADAADATEDPAPTEDFDFPPEDDDLALPDFPAEDDVPAAQDMDAPAGEDLPEIPDLAVDENAPADEELPEIPDLDEDEDAPTDEELPEIPGLAEDEVAPADEELPEIPDLTEVEDVLAAENTPEIPDLAVDEDLPAGNPALAFVPCEDPMLHPIEELRPPKLPSEQKLTETFRSSHPVMALLLEKLPFFGLMDMEQLCSHMEACDPESIHQAVSLLISRGYVASYLWQGRTVICFTQQMYDCLKKASLSLLLHSLTRKKQLYLPTFLAEQDMPRDIFQQQLQRGEFLQSFLNALWKVPSVKPLLPDSVLDEEQNLLLKLVRPGRPNRLLLLTTPEDLPATTPAPGQGVICHAGTLPDMPGVDDDLHFCLTPAGLHQWRDGAWFPVTL